MYQKRNKELVVLTLYLGDYTRQFYLREISKVTKIPIKTTQNVMLNLEKNNILRSHMDGKNKYFKLNLDNIQTKFYLLQAEIHKTQLFIDRYQPFKTFLKPSRLLFCEIKNWGLIKSERSQLTKDFSNYPMKRLMINNFYHRLKNILGVFRQKQVLHYDDIVFVAVMRPNTKTTVFSIFLFSAIAIRWRWINSYLRILQKQFFVLRLRLLNSVPSH